MGAILTTPCRVWRGGLTRGYGQRRVEGRVRLVHRWIWEQIHGPIPPGMVVMHRCDNPPCFRLDHLQLGTQKQNVADMIAKERQNFTRDHSHLAKYKGELASGAKLTEAQVGVIRELIAEGLTRAEIGRRFGVHATTILRIANGKGWTS